MLASPPWWRTCSLLRDGAHLRIGPVGWPHRGGAGGVVGGLLRTVRPFLDRGGTQRCPRGRRARHRGRHVPDGSTARRGRLLVGDRPASTRTSAAAAPGPRWGTRRGQRSVHRRRGASGPRARHHPHGPARRSDRGGGRPPHGSRRACRGPSTRPCCHRPGARSEDHRRLIGAVFHRALRGSGDGRRAFL